MSREGRRLEESAAMIQNKARPVRAAAMSRMLAVVAAAVFALASMMLLPGTASSQTADRITLTAVQVTTGAREVEVAPGDTVKMIIKASGAEAMQGLQFTLVYNPAVVEVVDVSMAESLPEALFAANTGTPSEIVVVFLAQAPVGLDELDIANVTFRVVGEPGASTSLSFRAIAAGDPSVPSQAISTTSVGASITVMSQQGDPTPTEIPASTPLPVPTDVPNTPTPSPSPSPPAVTPEVQQTPVAMPQPVPTSSPEPTSTATAAPVAMAPAAAPTTQAPAASPTPARPEPSLTAAAPEPPITAAAPAAAPQKPAEAASPAPLAAQVAGATQRPEVASAPELGAVAPTPSAAQVQVQASQAGSEPTPAPPSAEPQGGMGCNAPLRGSSTSVSGLGDLMLLGTVVGSLLISSRFRRQR